MAHLHLFPLPCLSSLGLNKRIYYFLAYYRSPLKEARGAMPFPLTLTSHHITPADMRRVKRSSIQSADCVRQEDKH